MLFRSLVRASDMVGDSVRALNPVKTLASASDTVGDSVSALKPVNNLSTTSEIGGASDRNFPADLLMLSKIDEARSSGIALNPVKTLASASDTVGISVRSLKPVNNLSTISVGAGVSVKLPDTDIPERRAGHWCMSLYEALVG